MRVLLLAMPNIADNMDYFARFPNLALVSLAGNLRGHRVKVLDLVTCRTVIKEKLQRILKEFKPQVVGLSGMTFQFATLLRTAAFIKKLAPEIITVAGGYHVTLLGNELEREDVDSLDFMVRGEGERTFSLLLSALEQKKEDFSCLPGLSYRVNSGWAHNPRGDLLDLEQIHLPDRSTRLSEDFFVFDLEADVAETSRGCSFNCNFCSITNMYGRTVRKYPIARIISDLKSIADQGKKAVFFTDDNINIDVSHFRNVCQAIIDTGLNHIFYTTQMSAVSVARNPDMVADMAAAGFKTVFVGFESMEPADLSRMNKPTSPAINREAAALLRKHHIGIVAGGIFGFADDTKKTVARNFKLYKELKPDILYPQFLTPYPKTKLREEMVVQGLIVNKDDYSKYDGFTCNIRTRHMTQNELFRCLRLQGLKIHFDLKFLYYNQMFRWKPWRFLKIGIHTLANRVRNVVTNKPIRGQIDI